MQVLTDGIYFINRLFANVDIVPKSIIDIGYVGVVVSYFGDKGEDVSGADYSHGELVEQGRQLDHHGWYDLYFHESARR